MKPLILAFDTTSEHGSLALSRGEDVLEEVALYAPEGFSGVLFGEIARLLERHNVRLADVEAYAPAAGPGSFTGVRVGMTAAKGLAVAHGRPLVPVSNLAAVAALALAQTSGPQPLAPILDARRGDVFLAVYSAALERLLEPLVTTPQRLPALVSPFGEVLYCGPEATKLAPPGAACVMTPRALAAAIARLAAHELAAGRGLDPAAAEAEYVRRPDIKE